MQSPPPCSPRLSSLKQPPEGAREHLGQVPPSSVHSPAELSPPSVSKPKPSLRPTRPCTTRCALPLSSLTRLQPPRGPSGCSSHTPALPSAAPGPLHKLFLWSGLLPGIHASLPFPHRFQVSDVTSSLCTTRSVASHPMSRPPSLRSSPLVHPHSPFHQMSLGAFYFSSFPSAAFSRVSAPRRQGVFVSLSHCYIPRALLWAWHSAGAQKSLFLKKS